MIYINIPEAKYVHTSFLLRARRRSTRILRNDVSFVRERARCSVEQASWFPLDSLSQIDSAFLPGVAFSPAAVWMV